MMFLEARHLFSGLCCTLFLKKKKRFSRIWSNMKAYVIVQGFVANIRNIVDHNDPKLFTSSVANDLVGADRLF